MKHKVELSRVELKAHTQRDEGRTSEINSGLCAGKQFKCGLKAREWREILSIGGE